MRLGKCLDPSRSLPNESKSRIYQQFYGRIYPFDDLAAAGHLKQAEKCPLTALLLLAAVMSQRVTHRGAFRESSRVLSA